MLPHNGNSPNTHTHHTRHVATDAEGNSCNNPCVWALTNAIRCDEDCVWLPATIMMALPLALSYPHKG